MTDSGKSPAAEALNEKQLRFCHEYIISLDGTKAYKEVYDTETSRSASNGASRLMQRPEIRAYIEELKLRRIQRTDVDADRVVAELARLGFSDIRNVMNWSEHTIKWHPSDDISDEAAATISEISETIREVETEHNDDVQTTKTTTRRMKLHSKISALQKLSDHVGVGDGTGGVRIDLHVGGMSEDEKDEEYKKLFEEIDEYREVHEDADEDPEGEESPEIGVPEVDEAEDEGASAGRGA